MFSSIFNTGPAAVCLNSCVDEAVVNTESDLVQQFAAVQPVATDFQCIVRSGILANYTRNVFKNGADIDGSLMADCPAVRQVVPRRAINALDSCQSSASQQTVRGTSTSENIIYVVIRGLPHG